ncbi:MAG: hypothetical protein Q9M40_07265 [Sulfurimonas sp.]|nr:hypothetical protein [Sulfurimonas sp.]
MFKTINNGKLPTRGSKYSACVDLYANKDVTIGAGETVLIPLGVCIDLDKLKESYIKIAGNYEKSVFEMFLKSHYLQLMLRSSLSKDLIIANGVGVIDMDFIPSCKLNLALHNRKRKGFKPKQKEL